MTEDRITYACSDCGATDCKLWRPAQTFSPSLRCANCVLKRDDTANIASLDKNGMSTCLLTPDHRTYCLGGYHVPAVPTPDWTTGFWGYLAIPEEGIAWWRYLPSLPTVKPEHCHSICQPGQPCKLDMKYTCGPCFAGQCDMCDGCTCQDDNHGAGHRTQKEVDAKAYRPEQDCGLRGCTINIYHSHTPHEINTRRLDAIANGTERGDPMG